MVDLGQYAVEVLTAYGVTAVILAGIGAMTWTRATRIRRALEEAERDA